VLRWVYFSGTENSLSTTIFVALQLSHGTEQKITRQTRETGGREARATGDVLAARAMGEGGRERAGMAALSHTPCPSAVWEVIAVAMASATSHTRARYVSKSLGLLMKNTSTTRPPARTKPSRPRAVWL
jgi:hypothetical protein